MDPRQELQELEELAALEERAKAGSLARRMGHSLIDTARSAYSGGLAAARDLATLPYKGIVGLGLAGLSGSDKLLGTNLLEPAETALAKLEAPIRNQPDIAIKDAIADFTPKDPAQRYVKQITAGAMGGAVGPGPLATTGMVTGAMGGAAGEAASQAGMHPAMQLLATILPAGTLAGLKAIRDPVAVQQIKAAMAATSAEDLEKARKLIEVAQTRGVQLSPAQAFGRDHPLVSILEQVGHSAGGSSKTKIFLGAQTQPTNRLTDQVTRAFGETDTATAANTVAKRAASIRAAQELGPSKTASPFYNAAGKEVVPPTVVQKIVDDLTDLASKYSPKSKSRDYIEGAIEKLRDGSKSIEETKLILSDSGMMELAKTKKPALLDFENYAKLNNLRKEMKPASTNVLLAGTDNAGAVPKHVAREVYKVFKEGAQTSPNIAKADAIFSKRMDDLNKVRLGPLTQLAGTQMRNEDAAQNFSRVSQFLDPARHSPVRIDRTLAKLSEPKERVVQQLAAGFLRNAKEQARKAEGYTPAKIETLLRGGDDSGKAQVFNVLMRRALNEQNRAHTIDPVHIDDYIKNLNTNLDIMEATGLGRGAMTSVENLPRVAAQLDTPVQAARASAGNIVSTTPSIIRAAEMKANRELAGALTDPTLKRLLEMRDYDRKALIAELLRRATQTGIATGDGD